MTLWWAFLERRLKRFALAIDQLRLLRNVLLHSATPEIDKVMFDQHVQISKDAFKALGLKTDPIDANDHILPAGEENAMRSFAK